MREFTCVVCGAKGIDKSARQDKKYCGKDCANKARSFKRGNLIETAYLNNNGVLCGSPNCDRCGWNPAVERLRKEMLNNGEK